MNNTIKERELLGLYISDNGDDENSSYLYGTLSNFKAFLSNYNRHKRPNLCFSFASTVDFLRFLTLVLTLQLRNGRPL